jgi:hypothetical protein
MARGINVQRLEQYRAITSIASFCRGTKWLTLWRDYHGDNVQNILHRIPLSKNIVYCKQRALDFRNPRINGSFSNFKFQIFILLRFLLSKTLNLTVVA